MTQPDSYPIVAIAVEVVRMLATFDGSGLNVSEEPRQPNPAREEFGVVDQDIDERLDLTMRMELLDNAMGDLPTEAVVSAGGKMATGASQRTQTALSRAPLIQARRQHLCQLQRCFSSPSDDPRRNLRITV